MTEWAPATEAETAMRDALLAGDQERYFAVLAAMTLLLPTPPEMPGDPVPAGWATWNSGGRTHVLAFTSPESMRACLPQHGGGARGITLADLARAWPNRDWWLAVDPGLPIESYLPAWFVSQVARGDARVPGAVGARPRAVTSVGRARVSGVPQPAGHGYGDASPRPDEPGRGSVGLPGDQEPGGDRDDLEEAPAALLPYRQSVAAAQPGRSPAPRMWRQEPASPAPWRDEREARAAHPEQDVQAVRQEPTGTAAPPAAGTGVASGEITSGPEPARRGGLRAAGQIWRRGRDQRRKEPPGFGVVDDEAAGPRNDEADAFANGRQAQEPRERREAEPDRPAYGSWAGDDGWDDLWSPTEGQDRAALGSGADPGADAVWANGIGAYGRPGPAGEAAAGFGPEHERGPDPAYEAGRGYAPEPEGAAEPEAALEAGRALDHAGSAPDRAGSAPDPAPAVPGPADAGSPGSGEDAGRARGRALVPGALPPGTDLVAENLQSLMSAPEPATYRGGTARRRSEAEQPDEDSQEFRMSAADRVLLEESGGGWQPGAWAHIGSSVDEPAPAGDVPRPGDDERWSGVQRPAGRWTQEWNSRPADEDDVPLGGDAAESGAGALGAEWDPSPNGRAALSHGEQLPDAQAAPSEAGATPGTWADTAAEAAPPWAEAPAVDVSEPDGWEPLQETAGHSPYQRRSPDPGGWDDAASAIVQTPADDLLEPYGTARAPTRADSLEPYGTARAPAGADSTAAGYDDRPADRQWPADDAIGPDVDGSPYQPSAGGEQAVPGRHGDDPNGRDPAAPGVRAGSDPDGFTPATDTEATLLDAASAGRTDSFLSTLLLATVLLPVAPGAQAEARPGDPGFRWPQEPIEDQPFVTAFTSRERLVERLGEVAAVPVRFMRLIRHWPQEAWTLTVNPATPIGAVLPGAQIRGLATWAAEVGLDGEDTGPMAPAPQPAYDRRDHEPPTQRPVLMQKPIPPAQVPFYLERGYDRVSGFVHRAAEVEHLSTPQRIVASLGLGYPGSPFGATDTELYVLRWAARCEGLYRLPYGGQTESAMRAMEGWVIERAPFRGNGFAPSDSGDVIAEFKVDSVRLPHGAEIWRMTRDGEPELVATLDADLSRWRPAGES